MAEVGKKYGAWLVVKDLGYKSKYECVCTACQTAVKAIRSYDLVNRKTLMCKSCASSANPKPIEYHSWVAMTQRCHNPNSKDYPNYGGRGIQVCDMWRKSFEAFYMSVGPRPEPHYTIERIDTNGNYEPGNVKWATRAEQTRNQRNNVKLTIDGKTMTTAEWSTHPDCTVSKFTIYKRLKRGWEPERAVFENSNTNAKKIK